MLVILTPLFSFTLFSQSVTIEFDAFLNQKSIQLNPGSADQIEVETLKFYISDLILSQGDEKVAEHNNRFHLIDFDRPESLIIVFDSIGSTFDQIEFSLGVDSLTNESGAFGGALDPTNGMYWTWQSGYINFKVEGVSESCPARKNRFQFHAGGYQAPFKSLRKLNFISDQRELKITLDLDALFTKVNLTEEYEIMSPSKRTLDFLDHLIPCFKML